MDQILKITKLEKTAKTAYRNAKKFIYKYGRISGLAELYYQYFLNETEIKTILFYLVKNNIIDNETKKDVLKEINL